MMFVKAASQFIFVFLWAQLLWGAEAFQVPELSGPVVDSAHMLKPSTVRTLSVALESLASSTNTQMAVLIVPSLQNLQVEEAALKVVEKWGLGKNESDRGLLLLLAAKERKVRFEVGQGLEGDLPDVVAFRIISNTIVPLLKQKDVDGAVILGVVQAIEHVEPKFPIKSFFDGSALTQPRGHKRGLPLDLIIILIILAFLFVVNPLLGLLFGSRASRSRNSSYLPSDFGGGFGGGSWGGGGGFSGGGGGFSGGGASGDW